MSSYNMPCAIFIHGVNKVVQKFTTLVASSACRRQAKHGSATADVILKIAVIIL
jgi:hypothetical protein